MMDNATETMLTFLKDKKWKESQELTEEAFEFEEDGSMTTAVNNLYKAFVNLNIVPLVLDLNEGTAYTEDKRDMLEHDRWLKSLKIDRMGIHLLVGVLTITNPCKEYLPSRVEVGAKIKARCKVLQPDRWEELVTGLLDDVS